MPQAQYRILPSINSIPYFDLAQLVLPTFAQGLFMVSLFSIVMSTIDSFSFISAFTIGKDLSPIFHLKQDDISIVWYTRWGLIITSLLSVMLAIYFENAVDIFFNLALAAIIPITAIWYGSYQYIPRLGLQKRPRRR